MVLSETEKNKVWLVIGACGQDGSHFLDILIEKGYNISGIHGTMRRSSSFNTSRIDHIFNKITMHYIDLTDATNVFNIIGNVRPDYIVNFAAQSHVQVSSELSNYTLQVNTIGVLNILQSVKTLELNSCRIYQASTSEMYGNAIKNTGKSLNEYTTQTPVSIYGISKMASEHLCNYYRDAYGMFIVNSILFNHTGPRRGGTFVTQKIANFVKKYKNNSDCVLELGNLNAKRDWGYAKDYCEAIYLMLLQPNPDNYVIASGETHSVREFVEKAFKCINIEVEWKGEGIDEVGIDKNTGKIIIRINPRYYRAIDIDCLLGDYSKAKRILEWEPKTSFDTIVRMMVN